MHSSTKPARSQGGTEDPTTLGTITISPRVVSTIVSQTALQTYGVVGMAARGLVNGFAHILTRNPQLGVEIRVEDGAIHVDVYVVMEYGTRLSTVALALIHSIRFHVERALGLPVAAVRVHIQDLHITHTN